MSAVSLDVTPKGSVEIETLVNGPIQTNSYAVISDNECVIIDSAWEGERLVEHIRAKHPGVRMLGAVCTWPCRSCWWCCRRANRRWRGLPV